MTVQLSDENFDEEVINSTVPVLVDFWAAWCGPCKLIAPAVEEIAREYEGRLKVCKFDIEQGVKTASRFGIMSIPTLLVFKGGDVKDQIVGSVPKEHITKKIESVL